MEEIKLLGISASPRRRGDSWYLLECAVWGAKRANAGSVESELYSISGKEIRPCVSCLRCAELGDYAIGDDFHELRDTWVAADAIIYSVPAYHMGIPGQLKCFIDRLGNTLYHYYGGVAVRNLKTVGVTVQGSHIFAGHEQVVTTLINHAVLLSCMPVAGDPWQSYLGAAGWTRDRPEKDSLRRLHQEEEPDARVAVAAAESLGKRVVQVALVLNAGRMACRNMLMEDGSYDAFLTRLRSGNEEDLQER